MIAQAYTYALTMQGSNQKNPLESVIMYKFSTEQLQALIQNHPMQKLQLDFVNPPTEAENSAESSDRTSGAHFGASYQSTFGAMKKVLTVRELHLRLEEEDF